MNREPNRYLGLYDKPLARDWVWWLTVACIPLWVLVIMTPTEGSAEQTVGSIIFGFFFTPVLFGLPVAVVRKISRSRRAKRRSASYLGDVAAEIPGPRVVPRQTAGGEASAPSPDQPDAAQARYGYAPLNRSIDEPSFKSWTLAPSVSDLLPASVTPIGSSREISDGWNRRSESLPFPIARAARHLGSTASPLEQYSRLLDCAETTTTVTGIIAAVWLNDESLAPKDIKDLLGRYRRTGVTFGVWLPLIDRFVDMAASSTDPFARRFSSALRDGSFTAHARSILEERNRSAHGGQPRNKGDAALRLAELEPHLAGLMDSLGPLATADLLLIESSQYSRRTGHFVVRAGRMMGDHPDFRPVELEVDAPLAAETIYLATGSRFVDLTPFLVYRFCPTCRQPEVLYADRTFEASREVSLRAFASGHQTRDELLFEDFDLLVNGPSRAAEQG
ncbi:hypothetical protein FB459_0464 [Yimella lutea]|uniref:Uncharacterized protein n=1 Tax=Yimella lutea TaxID=587872 RepID=A0A542ECL3_9MICO|nr:hypothetical protein [Yimella lutea]TQJ13069.1 hypothetical protein FB459_0464 [Yimella lutea]